MPDSPEFLVLYEPIPMRLHYGEQEAAHGRTVVRRRALSLLVERASRNRGLGREAVRIVREGVWSPDKRITIGVLTENQVA